MVQKKTPGTTPMNLLFCDSKPMMLPDDKQRELAIALAELLLGAADRRQRLRKQLLWPSGVAQPHDWTPFSETRRRVLTRKGRFRNHSEQLRNVFISGQPDGKRASGLLPRPAPDHEPGRSHQQEREHL